MEKTTLSKGEQTRLQIIEAATQLFLKQGFHGTSMREIAQGSNIALGSIYNHFATKEDIFEAVFLAYHPYNTIIPAVQNASGDTVEELLRNIASYIIGGLKNNPDFINLLYIDIVEFQKNYTLKILRKGLPLFKEVYDKVFAAEPGRIRPLPPFIIMRSFFGLFFSYYFTEVILSGDKDILNQMSENAFDHFIDIYLHGILNINEG
ncbi:MAG: TetR/AcrR family transcriptional regulator [Anaerolineae bacterium]|nr:TetR/AcrR family transcriptional regulator [Anaerolineae bacterium]